MKKTLNILLRVGISCLLLFLLFKKVDVKGLFDVIVKADVFDLGVAVVILVFAQLFCLMRWDLILRSAEFLIPLRRVAVSFLGGVFFSLFLPSTIGGDVVRSVDLVAHTKRSKEVVATVLLDRLSGFVGLVMVSLVALGLGLRYITDPLVIFGTLGIALLLMFVVLLVFNERLFLFVNGLLKSRRQNGIRDYFKNVHQEIYHFRGRSAVICKTLVLSVVIQFMTSWMYWFLARALGLNVNISYFLIFVPLISTIALMPISLGGLGLRDVSTVFLFAKVGVPHNVALAISLLYFGCILSTGVLGGMVYGAALHSRWLQRRKKP